MHIAYSLRQFADAIYIAPPRGLKSPPEKTVYLALLVHAGKSVCLTLLVHQG